MTRPESASPAVIQAVLWDVDGTLIDSEHLHRQVFLEVCQEHGLILDPHQALTLMGATPEHKWRFVQARGGLGISRDQWRREYNQRYAAGVRRTMQRREVVAVVRVLEKAGIPQACVSNGDPAVVQTNLDLLQLGDCFRFRMCNGDFERGKPHPQPYRLACRRLGLEPACCLAVEDSATGIESALRAGLLSFHWPLPGQTPLSGLQPHFAAGNGGFPWHLLPQVNPPPRTR
ncbi:MAG: HAD family phosphatase [Desulfarculaceae bacterium]|jgi:HAD superfamily hydrolase (TIGR01509 family)